MYLRSLHDWIGDVLGMTSQKFKNSNNEDQFQSAMRNKVATSIVLYKAGYFLNIPKCFLIPERVMAYLGIECDTIRCRFKVLEDRAQKYRLVLQKLLTQNTISFGQLASIVGKLASIEVVVTAGL